jgi:hypothetical protein
LSWQCGLNLSRLLPDLLASGAVEEIDEATYQAAMPPPSI